MNRRSIERRQMLREGIAFAALAPMAMLGLPIATANARMIGDPPNGEFILRRVLERGLGDGKSILVTREWVCRFAASRAGARVTGEQVGVEVEAPARLAQLAEMERARKVTQFLPVQLDRDGRIVAAGQVASSPDMTDAAHAAAEIIAQLPSRVTVEDARLFLESVGRTAAQQVSRIPPDLFFPAPGASREQRQVPLPGGGYGEIEIAISASADPQTGLLRSSERRIVTRVAKEERNSRESWRLTAK